MRCIDNLKCSECKFYKGVYIHPWSKCDDALKQSTDGFCCTLFEDDKELDRIDVLIGLKDSIGCEMFTKKRNNPWHTGTPTEGGLYFVYDKYSGYGKRELKKNISMKQLEIAFHDVLAWQKIDPYKGEKE